MSDEPMACRVWGTPCPSGQSCLCHPHPFEVETCGRVMIGSGTDTYDPVCELPSGHSDACRSTAAVDQYRIVRALGAALSDGAVADGSRSIAGRAAVSAASPRAPEHATPTDDGSLQ